MDTNWFANGFSKMSTDEADPFTSDPVFHQQQHHHNIGYARGTSAGEELGWRDGYVVGLRQAAQLSTEIGYYEGFARAWIAILGKSNESSDARKLTALRTLLEMCTNFPRETKQLKEDDDVKQKMVRIRAKYRQVSTLVCGSGAQAKLRGPSWARNEADGSSPAHTSSAPDIDF